MALTGWTYRKPVTLSRASGAVTNYQMELKVGESVGSGTNDVLATGCKTDFSDLRFTKYDGTTLLDYYIEGVTGATPNQVATIWIEFDSIGTGSTSFYMYYGNAGAAAASNGPNTFLFFDDFSGTLTDKWDGTTGWSNSGGICTGIRAGTNLTISGKSAFATNTMWRTRQKSAHSNNASFTESFGLTNVGGSVAYFRAYYSYSGNNHKYVQYYGSWDTGVDMAGWDATTYHILTVKRNGTTSTISTVDDANTVTKTSCVPQGNMSPNMDLLFQDSSSILMDWIFCSQWLATGPAWGTWGAEEAMSAIPVFLSQFRRRTA